VNIKRALMLAALAVPLLWALLSGFGRDPHAVPSMFVGKPAPPFVLRTVHGQEVTLPQGDKLPVLVNFWATWCYPCQAEHALLQQTAAALEGRAHVLGIIYNDSAEAVATYVAKHGGVYPQLLDPNSRVAMDYGVAGVPESFIIDGQGIIVHKQAGVMRPEVLQRHLMPLLADAPPPTSQKGSP
jgi:cytochrome c biogenesis protein CcmG/thiol:disulfide interchange protein DsbE